MSYTTQMAARALRARCYRAAHPDKKREANRKYYLANKEKCVEINARWRKKNWPLIKIQIKCRVAGIKVPSISELRAPPC